jgi:hypothetical protein
MVLMVSALMLTIGLSVSKNTVTETKVDTDEDLLKQAFNTAESGVEYYLGTGNTLYSEADSNATITTVDIGNKDEINSGGVVLSGEPFLFWLVNHDDNGDIGVTYYSGNELELKVDDGYDSILKVDYYYKDENTNTYGVSRQLYDFGTHTVDEEIKGATTINGSTTINFDLKINEATVNPLLLVVTPIAKATALSLSGTAAFPLQGEEIVSYSTTDSGIKTQIKTRHIFQLPTFFLEAMTARGQI